MTRPLRSVQRAGHEAAVGRQSQPLTAYCRSSPIDTIAELLKNGADVDELDDQAHTPLYSIVHESTASAAAEPSRMSERDHDGDVVMSVPQPLYVPVLAPRLAAWDQASLIAWVNERRQYEEKIRARCSTTGVNYDSLIVSIRSSIDPRTLEHIARFVLKKKLADVTDKDLGTAITNRCSTLKNAHIPDLSKLFKEKLRMDLREDDTEARILKYFMLFDQIIEEHGLESLLGSDREQEAGYKERMTLRCKYLLANVAPEMLKVEVERLVIAKPSLKENEVELYETLVERAREQQHYHILSMELKNPDRNRTKSTPKETTTPKFIKKGSPNLSKNQDDRPHQNGRAEKPSSTQSSRKPPRDGCLLCGGPHWVAACSATGAEKEEALKQAKERKEQRLRAKRVKSLIAQGDRAVIINGVLEVPYRADTAADKNAIPRRIVQELVELACDVQTQKMIQPNSVEVADGRMVVCNEECELDVQVVTAAGLVRLRRLKCIVLEGESEEFLLGDDTLKSLGIDVDQMLEKLAAKLEPGADDDDDVPDDDIVGVSSEDDVVNRIHAMLDEAAANGFPVEYLDALKAETKSAQDVWRTKLGADPPAKLEPVET